MRRTVEIPGLGKITAEDSTLNEIALWAAMASEKWTAENIKSLSKSANEASNEIYSFLWGKGYFKK